MLNDEIHDAEWIRFHEYTRRVRKIWTYCGSTTESALLSLLVLQNGGKALFPFLQHLEWEQLSPFDTSILALLSPSVRHLAIDFVGDQYDAGAPTNREYALAMLLRAASSRCPMLDKLIVDGFIHPLSISTIASWQHLRSVRLDSTLLDDRSLHTLSTMTSLIELSLTFRERDFDFSAHNGFHCLQKLVLFGHTANIGKFISTISSSQLHHIHLFDMSPDVGPEDSRDLLTMLVSQFGASLRQILYKGGDALRSRLYGDRPLLDVIGPLLGARNLEMIHIVLNFTAIFDVSDHDIETMASTWTKATSLRLSLSYLHGNVTPSLRSLLHFRRHCPLLDTLSLPYVEVEPLPTMESTMPATPHPLHYLGIGNPKVTITDPCRMARFLNCSFPKLSVDRSFSIHRNRSGWEEVVKLLRTYRRTA